MKTIYITMALSLLSTAALATENHNNSGGNQTQTQQQNQNSDNRSWTDNNNSNKNSNNNDNYAKASSGSYSGAVSGSASGAIATGGKGGQGGDAFSQNSVDASSSNNNTNGASNNTYVNYRRNPVSSAFAAALTAGDDTCMGSTSAGVQGVSFGASLGSTWRDEDCIRRKDARTLYALGYGEAGVNRLCQSKDIALAMEQAGTPCPQVVEKEESTIKGGFFKGAVADYPGDRQYK